MRKLTEAEAQVLRKIIQLPAGAITFTGVEVATIYEMLASPYLSIAATPAGHAAFREYEAGPPDRKSRSRIALGMSLAGRAAL